MRNVNTTMILLSALATPLPFSHFFASSFLSMSPCLTPRTENSLCARSAWVPPAFKPLLCRSHFKWSAEQSACISSAEVWMSSEIDRCQGSGVGGAAGAGRSLVTCLLVVTLFAKGISTAVLLVSLYKKG